MMTRNIGPIAKRRGVNHQKTEGLNYTAGQLKDLIVYKVP